MNSIWKNISCTLPLNHKNKIEGRKLLSYLNSDTIKVCFFDPQYRGVLDKLSYGNEGKQRGKQRSELTQMSFEIIEEFLNEIERVLVPSGYLFLWVDKFHLVEGIKSWFKNDSKLNCVDMITWDKEKIGMGYRTRRKSEYLVVIQKEPKLAKATWILHDIPDVWQEKVKKEHPHSKPIELQTKLIEATCKQGDFILDPAAGGYSVLKCAQNMNIDFIGGDIEFGEEIKNANV